MKPLLAFIAVAFMLGTTGCRPVGAPNPTPIQQAAVLLDDFASSAQAAQTTEIAIYQKGLIDPATHVAIQKAFLKVAADETTLSNLMTASASSTSVSSAVAALTADLSGALTSGVLGVKDVASQQQLSSLVTVLGTTASQIAVAYGN